jgi:hypothetical protein
MKFEELKGMTIKDITGLEQYSDCVTLNMTNGRKFRLVHHNECCEEVSLEDFIGDMDSLKNAKIIHAHISSNQSPLDILKPKKPDSEMEHSFTWSFYNIDTDKGPIWMRWLGESNGYYSEEVDFEEVK